jgi:chromosome segregation ATPase
MSVITEILERLSGIEIVKERIRDTGARMEQWTSHVVALDRQVQEIDRRLVRIETFAEVAGATRKASRRLPRPE